LWLSSGGGFVVPRWVQMSDGPNYIIPSLYPSVTPIITEIWGCRGCKLREQDLHPKLLVIVGSLHPHILFSVHGLQRQQRQRENSKDLGAR